MSENIVTRPQRWDQPFDDNMRDEHVDKVLSSLRFKEIDKSSFPKTLALREIIRNDCRLRTFEKNQLIVRSGEYVNSAFIVLSGEVALLPLPEFAPNIWGQGIKREKPTLAGTVLRWLGKNTLPEVRQSITAPLNTFKKSKSGKNKAYTTIKNLDELIQGAVNKPVLLGEGELFGESAVLGRSEMIDSVAATVRTEVIEIRWQGLRDIRKYNDPFKAFIDHRYREHGLYSYLLTVPLFKGIEKEKIRELSERVLFEVHGEFEWQSSFQEATKQVRTEDDYDKIIKSEPVIACEGDYPDGLLIVRNGFVRVSRSINFGYYTMGYLGSGAMLGLQELYEAWNRRLASSFRCSFGALGYTDVIRIPTYWLEENVFEQKRYQPEIQQALNQQLIDDYPGASPSPDKQLIDRKLTEFFVENRYINGTKTMVIDLERCIHCDDCVTACADAHDNNPRFKRHGKSFGRYMIANACMHCDDPVCMIGCPTGAIARSPDGVVTINDPTCIGCSTCANHCPYNNITMVEVRDASGALYKDAAAQPILKASNCDLCSNSLGGPACERACAHDALTRIDLKDITTFSDWINR